MEQFEVAYLVRAAEGSPNAVMDMPSRLLGDGFVSLLILVWRLFLKSDSRTRVDNPSVNTQCRGPEALK